MKFYQILCFLCFFTISLNAQDNGFAEFKMEHIGAKSYKPTYKPTWKWEGADSLFVLVENGQKYLMHTIRPKQTLYSIKKFYAVDLSDIYYSNPDVERNGLKVGQKLRIPLVNKAIKRYRGQGFVDTSFIPIYYQVRPSETLYRISRSYFRIPMEILKSRNGMIGDELSKEQTMLIGWISREGIPDSLKRFTGLTGVLGEENQKNKYRYETKFNGKNEKIIQGTACWDKKMDLSGKNKLYVMSSIIPKGGVVRLENPMTNRFLYAKVVAPKPENSFTQKSIVMLTPTVAQALGALDSRFYVKLYYCK